MRQPSLDGLRGILAFAVVIYHMHDQIGIVGLHAGTSVFGHAVDALANFPIKAGPFAVIVFFAISGFVLAGALDRPRLLRDRWYWPATRYLRLTLPMAFALLVTAVLRLSYGDLGYTPLTALHEAFWSVYVDHDHQFYNTVVWTMRIELVGSLLLFIICALSINRKSTPWWVAVPGLYFGGGSIFLGFALGAWAYDRNKVKPWSLSLPVGLLLVVGALILAAVSDTSEGRYYSSMVGVPSLGHRNSGQDAVWAFSALLLVIAAVGCAPLRAWLSSTVPAFLGRISFSLYLIHKPIMLTVFGVVPPPGTSIVWALCFLTASILAAWAMTLLVDEPVVRMLHSVTRKRQIAVPA